MRPSLGLNMKKYLPWAIIVIAFSLSVYEMIDDNPNRILFYTIMLLMMWGTSWFVEKMKDEDEKK